MDILGVLQKLALESGFAAFFITDGGWKNLVMILIAFVLLYLGIVKKFEPLLLCGIAFGCLLSNLSYFVGMGTTRFTIPSSGRPFSIPPVRTTTAMATSCRTAVFWTSSILALRPVFIPR